MTNELLEYQLVNKGIIIINYYQFGIWIWSVVGFNAFTTSAYRTLDSLVFIKKTT